MEKKPHTLEIGSETTESTPVAAVIEMGRQGHTEKIFYQGEKAVTIIHALNKHHDLSALHRMAQYIAMNNDVETAARLATFLCSPYTIEDFDHFDFTFSIGVLRCIAWAKGEKNCQLLKSVYDNEKTSE